MFSRDVSGRQSVVLSDKKTLYFGGYAEQKQSDNQEILKIISWHKVLSVVSHKHRPVFYPACVHGVTNVSFVLGGRSKVTYAALFVPVLRAADQGEAGNMLGLRCQQVVPLTTSCLLFIQLYSFRLCPALL